MTLQEIADSLQPEDILNYNREYKKTRRKQPWLHELLSQGYLALHSKVKIHTATQEWVPWQYSCSLLDRIVFTVAYIYQNKISSLEKELNELKRRTK